MKINLEFILKKLKYSSNSLLIIICLETIFFFYINYRNALLHYR